MQLSLYPPSLVWQTLELSAGLIYTDFDVVERTGAGLCTLPSSILPGPPQTIVAGDAQDVRCGLWLSIWDGVFEGAERA